MADRTEPGMSHERLTCYKRIPRAGRGGTRLGAGFTGVFTERGGRSRPPGLCGRGDGATNGAGGRARRSLLRSPGAHSRGARALWAAIALTLAACGSSGADGAAGKTGSRGATGADGAAGPAGAPGKDGQDGSTGARGPAGEQGPEGPPGPPGPAGTYAPSTWVSCVVTLDLIGTGASASGLLPDGTPETLLEYGVTQFSNGDARIDCHAAIGSAQDGSSSHYYPAPTNGAMTLGCAANADLPPLGMVVGLWKFGIVGHAPAATYQDPDSGQPFDGTQHAFDDSECSVVTADADANWHAGTLADVF